MLTVLIHRGDKQQRHKKRGDDESIRFLRKQEEKMSRYRTEGVQKQAFPLDAKTLKEIREEVVGGSWIQRAKEATGSCGEGPWRVIH